MECRISVSVALARQIYKEMNIYNLRFQHIFIGIFSLDSNLLGQLKVAAINQ